MAMKNVRASKAPVKPPVDPFACVPYRIGLAPCLDAVDVRIVVALLHYTKDKVVCWPSDRTIGEHVQRSRSTVQRHLRRLEAAGYIERDKSSNPNNRTGRLLRLTWRCLTHETPPVSSVGNPPVSPVRQECENEREKEKPATSRDGAGSRAEAENVVPEPEPTSDDVREIFAAMRERAAAAKATRLAASRLPDKPMFDTLHAKPAVSPTPAAAKPEASQAPAAKPLPSRAPVAAKPPVSRAPAAKPLPSRAPMAAKPLGQILGKHAMGGKFAALRQTPPSQRRLGEQQHSI
jgi:DNA-binding transcriptional ArsR family regulator